MTSKLAQLGRRISKQHYRSRRAGKMGDEVQKRVAEVAKALY